MRNKSTQAHAPSISTVSDLAVKEETMKYYDFMRKLGVTSSEGHMPIQEFGNVRRKEICD